MDNHCSPLLLPADLIEANYTGPSVCDCWYAFHPEAVKLGQMDPVNPTYAAGDCPDLDVEACFAREDMTYGPYAWPGGYTMIYLTVTKDEYSSYGREVEHIHCADCASKAKRDARLKRGDFWGGNFPTTLVSVEGSTYDEGPLLECDGCGKDMESSYGDPDEESEDDE